MMQRIFAFFALLMLSIAFHAPAAWAAGGEKAVKVVYRFTPPAPKEQSEADVAAKSEGCLSLIHI